MNIRLAIASIALLVAVWTTAKAADDVSGNVNLGAATEVLELKPYLKPYQPPANAKKESSVWFTFSAVNLSNQPINRVLHAGQPPSSGVSILPLAHRPMILQVVSTSAGVVVESSNAYGRKGYRITIPASAKIDIAVRMAGVGEQPSLLAWTEPAISRHNTQIGIFIAAVAGLIGAAVAICFGLAVMTHHWAPRWAGASLTALLLSRFASIGMFDGSIVTTIGGPYGLIALFGALSLAAGLRFVDLTTPLREVWPKAAVWLPRVTYLVLGLGALAYVGLPGATLLTDLALFLLPPAIFFYLLYRDRKGSPIARVIQPAAGLFAMVSVTSAFAGLGGFGSASIVPDLAGGFAAAGAILLALAVTAGEGITVIPWRHAPHPGQLPAPAPVRAAPAPRPAPAPTAASHAAMEAIGASRQGVFELDLVRNETILSADAAALVGMAAGRMPHRAWAERVHEDDRPVYEQAISEFRRQSGLAFRIEFRVLSEEGRYPWCELRATMKGPDGAAAERCVGLLADVTTRKEAEVEMMDRSLRDPLTGLGNRIALMEELEGLGGQLRSIVFAVLDIDRFKAIHASLGDIGGDDVLGQVAQRLQHHFNGFAEVFRVGGDAFAVLFKHTTEKPEQLGASLVQLCGGAYQFQGRSVFAPASIGVAMGTNARDPIELIKNAELALMQAKRQGGDCSRVYAHEMEASAPHDKVALDAELHAALEQGEIEVFYQPIVRLADRTVAGFEALLRWRHPAKGLVSPADFIAHSEETGAIVGLGLFALDRAASDLATWQRYFPLPEALFVSVNFSRRQLRDDVLLNRLAEILSNGGLAAGSLKLEMTESAIATDGDARALALRIRELGAGLAIDDFGTGMSSLSQLADLPFDTVKIDKGFLARMSNAGDDKSDGDVVLSSMVSMVHSLGRSVIIEGVETEADAARVAELGCEFAQGFLFSEAVTASEAMTYIARTFRSQAQVG
ncbi:MAG: GGDEF domain-containing protein [Rhizomicrobium sp.]|nr:GGDEF domain-containing protein [Rhizomicrobium sp.]